MDRLMLWATTQYLRLEGAAKRQEGQTMAEYALILVLVAVAAIGAFRLLGGNISKKVSSIATQIGP